MDNKADEIPFTGTETMGAVMNPGSTTQGNGRLIIGGLVQQAQGAVTDPAGVWWFPKIGMTDFKVDGTWSVSFQDTLVDEGTYTFDKGKVAWLDTSGTCKDRPATYEAYVARQDSKPVQLRMQIVGSDPCRDRANALSSPGKFQHP